jgi:hypothetical protein
MAKYRTIKQWLFQPPKDKEGKAPPPIVYPIGAEVEFDGLPSASNLEPLDAAAKTRMAEAEDIFEKQRREAKLKSTPAGMEMLAALAEALYQVKTGDTEVAEARAPIASAGEGSKSDHKAAALSRSTSSHGRSHSAE